ncbi:MAG: hypothetical protein COV74_00240 [Candidatus Omnitrophica bacterium CG11_big_fil_rev_8_21_14_0_20_45_26]|uniref:Uncharacterized protein n=1 Tax=Candidatus Abzuiibacterium crystallinum TaxID=1974748 RepID=A0A2H0LVK6_9BACT|nr:MAG: hypothetical protein COV74_00240 [Candidatus Omnitrophica bacterium CG11_big_fil_rev_8_21_14_0_20_45_26]PIW64632.1 MAG: hypothetical protein COW12_05535 [Candidatus Omnitrophica bacterium CG12_big_fil_rev_8_21_14_0_65_45_16]
MKRFRINSKFCYRVRRGMRSKRRAFKQTKADRNPAPRKQFAYHPVESLQKVPLSVVKNKPVPSPRSKDLPREFLLLTPMFGKENLVHGHQSKRKK